MIYHAVERLLIPVVKGIIHPGTAAADDGGDSVSKAGELHIGNSLATGQPILLSVEDRRRHLWLSGSTGSGKTNTILQVIDADVAARKIVIVIDRHGDLYDRVLLRLSDNMTIDPKRFCLLDLRADHVVGLSPFRGIGDVYSQAHYTLSVIKRQAPSWGVDLEQTLRFCLLALAEGRGSIVLIEPLLNNHAFRRKFLQGIRDPFVRSFFERFDSLRPEAQHSLTAPVLNKVSGLLAIPRVRLMFASPKPLALEKLLNTPGQIVLVSLASAALHDTAMLVGGIFIGMVATMAIARSHIPESQRLPISLIVDECEGLVTDAYETILAEGRKYGLSLTLANQNLHQLPTDLRETILANTGTQLMFQTSSGDAGHLSNELVSVESKEKLRQVLISQPVGCAFLARRGQASIQLQTTLSCDPNGPDIQRIIQVIEASSTQYALPIKAVEDHLAKLLGQGCSAPQPLDKAKEVVRDERRPIL